MAGVKILWTETAIRQRNEVLNYWIRRNGDNSYAKKLNQRIKSRIKMVAENIKIGRMTIFGNARVVTLGHYCIYYQLKSNAIFIICFWDNRRDSKQLLNLLKSI
jgi:plasmid stabilization system protein ParE